MTANKFKELIIKTSAEGGFPAVDNNGLSCVYLSDCGRKCVVGLTIPNGHPGQYCQGSVHTLYEKYPDLKEHIPGGLGIDIMSELQGVHDNLSLSTNWNHESFVERVTEIFASIPA